MFVRRAIKKRLHTLWGELSMDEQINIHCSGTWIKRPRSAKISLLYYPPCLISSSALSLSSFPSMRWHFSTCHSFILLFCFASFRFLILLLPHKYFPLEQMTHYHYIGNISTFFRQVFFLCCSLPLFLTSTVIYFRVANIHLQGM